MLQWHADVQLLDLQALILDIFPEQFYPVLTALILQVRHFLGQTDHDIRFTVDAFLQHGLVANNDAFGKQPVHRPPTPLGNFPG